MSHDQRDVMSQFSWLWHYALLRCCDITGCNKPQTVATPRKFWKFNNSVEFARWPGTSVELAGSIQMKGLKGGMYQERPQHYRNPSSVVNRRLIRESGTGASEFQYWQTGFFPTIIIYIVTFQTSSQLLTFVYTRQISQKLDKQNKQTNIYFSFEIKPVVLQYLHYFNFCLRKCLILPILSVELIIIKKIKQKLFRN